MKSLGILLTDMSKQKNDDWRRHLLTFQNNVLVQPRCTTLGCALFRDVVKIDIPGLVLQVEKRPFSESTEGYKVRQKNSLFREGCNWKE